jgi:ribosomal protein L4
MNACWVGFVVACSPIQRAWKRQPKKTKRMSEVSGSGKKPWKQKGTGRARAGHLRAPQRKKGAKAHGPVLRDYSISLNKKCTCLSHSFSFVSGEMLTLFDNHTL